MIPIKCWLSGAGFPPPTTVSLKILAPLVAQLGETEALELMDAMRSAALAQEALRSSPKRNDLRLFFLALLSCCSLEDLGLHISFEFSKQRYVMHSDLNFGVALCTRLWKLIKWLRARRSTLKKAPKRPQQLTVIGGSNNLWEVRMSLVELGRPNWKGNVTGAFRPIQRVILCYPSKSCEVSVLVWFGFPLQLVNDNQFCTKWLKDSDWYAQLAGELLADSPLAPFLLYLPTGRIDSDEMK